MGVGEKDFLISLLRHSQDRFLNKTVQSNQIVPWKDTFKVFKKVIAEILKTSPAASQSLITFEYELPFEDGNRPDVVLVLSNGHIVVVECKDKLKPSARDYNQVIYYRDRISRYHSKSHGLQNS
jgi:type I site-specific restriction-modification system R (restriction) subunit